MDFLTHMRFAHEANARIGDSLYVELQAAYKEIEQRDTLIHEARALNSVLMNENGVLNEWNQKQGEEIQILDKEIRAEIRKGKKKFIFGGIVGAFIGFTIKTLVK